MNDVAVYVVVGLVFVVVAVFLANKYGHYFKGSSIVKENAIYRGRSTLYDPKFGFGEIMEREDLDEQGTFTLKIDVSGGIMQKLIKRTYHESEIQEIYKPQVICDSNPAAWEVIRNKDTDQLKEALERADKAEQKETQKDQDFDARAKEEADRIAEVAKGGPQKYGKSFGKND